MSLTPGTNPLCNGATSTAYTGTPINGAWSSSNTAVATIGTNGIVTGISPGTASITYSTGCGASLSVVVTINGTTGNVTNNSPVCTGTNFNLDGSGITPTIGTTYSWAGPGIVTSGSSAIATVVSTTMSSNGLYTLTATNSGCSNKYTTLATLSQAPATPTISASPVSPICSGTPTTLSAAFATETPIVFKIPVYTPTFSVTNTLNSSTTFTSGTSNDGYYSTTIPFNFSFFGNTYSTVYIGTNGYVTFGSGSVLSVASTIPSSTPANSIALFQNDLTLASGGGTITYGVGGTAPNRQFIISYNAVSGNSSGGPDNGYIVLNETSGIIDAIVNTFTPKTGTKSACGIANSTGSTGVAATGRNNVTYTISTPEAWRFYRMNNYTYS